MNADIAMNAQARMIFGFFTFSVLSLVDYIVIAAHVPHAGPAFLVRVFDCGNYSRHPKPTARRMPYNGSAESLNEFICRLDFALGHLAVMQSPGTLSTKRHCEEFPQ